MAVHRIVRQQIIYGNIDELWQFFSDPNNLERLTPVEMLFKTTYPKALETIYPGMVITYKVAPLWRIPLFWMTEITHVAPLCRFVDEQRAGPYKLWHHQHHFRALDGGRVEMTDIVHYALPLGWLGDMVNLVLVRKKLNHIFDFRYRIVDQLFNSKNEG